MNEAEFVAEWGEQFAHCSIEKKHNAHPWIYRRDEPAEWRYWCDGSRLQEVVELPNLGDPIQFPRQHKKGVEANLPPGMLDDVGWPKPTPQVGDDWRADFRREVIALLLRYAWDARCRISVDTLAAQIYTNLDEQESGK